MSEGDDQRGVVVAPDSAEEANRVATALRAGGFSPTIDYTAMADRQGVFPVLVPAAEVGEAKGFLRGLRAGQHIVQTVAPSLNQRAPIASASAPAARSAFLPMAGRALALVTGLAAVAGGAVVLTNMLQFLSSLRDH